MQQFVDYGSDKHTQNVKYQDDNQIYMHINLYLNSFLTNSAFHFIQITKKKNPFLV